MVPVGANRIGLFAQIRGMGWNDPSRTPRLPTDRNPEDIRGNGGSGQNWIRTSEGVSQRIYSPPRLATSVSTLSRGVGGYTYPAISTQGFRAKISRFLTGSRGGGTSAPDIRRSDSPCQIPLPKDFLSGFGGHGYLTMTEHAIRPTAPDRVRKDPFRSGFWRTHTTAR